MKTIIAALAGLALAGCVHTSSEVLEGGYKSVHRSAKSAADMSRCISMNAEELRAVIPSHRPFGERGGIEIVIRFNQSTDVLAVAQVQNSQPGSITTLWLTPMAPLSHSYLEGELLRGC